MLKSATSLAALILTVPLAAVAEIHRWTDADGQVHFGDQPPTDAASEIVNVRPNVYDAPTTEALPEPIASAPGRVLLYSTRWCGFCTKARQYFQANGIAFDEYDVETSAKGKRDYARLGGGGVPVILVGGQRLNGFNSAAFERVYRGR
ncbi:glutaredoxin domain-containing protein [Thiohalocapsa sp. ML1]|jgi:glutaredoxin|uniref:glutaredoxin domain-containing protein n=1 Tax=Thiohalocapsa sp. ML1 TaxID=1431688 RepID=UPI0007321548|nr:glutaredoxin domain-containing protein [Thiohalocapsa sp. ML1]